MNEGQKSNGAEDSFIRFCCERCGKKIRVSKTHAGKKGRCPKCKSEVVIPIAEKVEPAESKGLFDDSGKIVLDSAIFDTPKESEYLTGQEEVSDGRSLSDDVQELKDKLGIVKTETVAERKLPWLIDIFLYPTSMSGLINLGIFWILPILLRFIGIILPIPFLWGILRLFVVAYMYYYFLECVRDSAAGGIRAPENIGSMPDTSDAVSQVWEIAVSVVIFWGPVALYSIYIPKTDTIFWILLGYGIFFFPMGFLALAMFKSTSAFNPILWLASILSTFFQYCALVLFFCLLGWLVLKIVSLSRQSLLFAYSLGAAFIYLAMVVSHLLGRFYFKYQDKLNWEV